ncbi:TPA: hypothetical protein DIV49_03285 [Candidatus Saccharibacteria bacterium]|nr:hypothetical protein [Candidatus Saccharibacteria bacterium]HRJ90758.1 hypothetical protein [Candidatus Saccharibacteria bacterium]
MGRLGLIMLALALLGTVCFAIAAGLRHLMKRARQRSLARHAPELLRFENLDPDVAGIIVQQKTQLQLGMNIVSQMLNDPVLLIPSEYTNPLEQWLETNRKELS